MTKSNMTVSKLQSEAVNKINPNIAIQKVAYAMALARDRAFKAGEIKDGKTTQEWKDYRDAKVKLSQTIADQIQKAVEETRKEIIDKLENIKKKRIMVDSGWFMIDIVEIEELLLSIQSKEK